MPWLDSWASGWPFWQNCSMRNPDCSPYPTWNELSQRWFCIPNLRAIFTLRVKAPPHCRFGGVMRTPSMSKTRGLPVRQLCKTFRYSTVLDCIAKLSYSGPQALTGKVYATPFMERIWMEDVTKFMPRTEMAMGLNALKLVASDSFPRKPR